MKVLLVEDIDRLGWLGDVIEVKSGYARNFLLPKGLAVIPIEANLKAIEKERAKRAEQRLLEKEQLEKAAEAVDGAEAVIAAKANEQGHLFGSVGAREIAVNLREQGFEVADKIVQLSEHIKQVGTYPGVLLKFAEDITAAVTVVVVAQPSDDKDSQDVPRDQ